MEMIILLWLPLTIAAAMFAHIRRGRNAFGWFVFAFFLSPFLAFVFLAILPVRPPSPRELRDQQRATQLRDEQRARSLTP
jgi:hypothetical protein